MELCDCSLDQIINEKKLSAKEIKEILEQLNKVFKIMSENAIIHRDIKPENILIKKLETGVSINERMTWNKNTKAKTSKLSLSESNKMSKNSSQVIRLHIVTQKNFL